MEPLSTHWADIAALKIISQRGDKDCYTLASGITPSGTVHIGNFREVITVDLVRRALEARGKKTRFIYSWDDFDTFRKVPKNLPNQEMLVKRLREPISRVPDPRGIYQSYAEGNIRPFEAQLARVGIAPSYIYQHAMYATGKYATQIREALAAKAKIAVILNEHRTSPLPDDWLPTAIYCERCDRDEMTYERYEGEWSYAYQCASCGHEATTDIRTTHNLKLNWRTDWPMRWAFEGVDFEPGGKDHSSEGGSYDTAKRLVKELWGKEPPVYLQYDFVSIKGGTGKMSSSSGELYTLDQLLEIYEPQMVRYLFAVQRPNHDFALAFDTDVIKLYDEFDRAEAAVYASGDDPKTKTLRRTYELSTVDGQLGARPPFRPSFRQLCNRLQICSGDVDRTLNRYYESDVAGEADRQAFVTRATCAKRWLEEYAPPEFRYWLNAAPLELELTLAQRSGLDALRQIVGSTDLETIDPKELNELVYERAIKATGVEGKEFFQAVYQRLIGRDQGPRLPSFLKEVGRERLLELL